MKSTPAEHSDLYHFASASMRIVGSLKLNLHTFRTLSQSGDKCFLIQHSFSFKMVPRNLGPQWGGMKIVLEHLLSFR